MYQVPRPRLELLCAQALQESVGPASAVPLLEAAHTTGDGRLLAQCRRYVADHAAEVRASGGVEQLRDFGGAARRRARPGGGAQGRDARALRRGDL